MVAGSNPDIAVVSPPRIRPRGIDCVWVFDCVVAPPKVVFWCLEGYVANFMNEGEGTELVC